MSFFLKSKSYPKRVPLYWSQHTVLYSSLDLTSWIRRLVTPPVTKEVRSCVRRNRDTNTVPVRVEETDETEIRKSHDSTSSVPVSMSHFRFPDVKKKFVFSFLHIRMSLLSSLDTDDDKTGKTQDTFSRKGKERIEL